MKPVQDEMPIVKRYWLISEAAEYLGEPRSKVRFWVNKFKAHLGRPGRGVHRKLTISDIGVLRKIRDYRLKRLSAVLISSMLNGDERQEQITLNP